MSLASTAFAGSVALPPTGGPPVVLLHGLTRSPASMATIAKALTAEGYRVCNVGYPSREHSIEVLAADYVAPAVAGCFPGERAPIDFVTHSMGGIIVRQLAVTHAVPTFGRVVMMGPPNSGSELIDRLGKLWLVRKVNGPAGSELGTSVDALPRRLGPATFEVGIVAGNRSYNLFYSYFFAGENDGKVSVASAGLEGMKDFVVVPATHTFMMRNKGVIRQAISFLKTGSFAHAAAVAHDAAAALLPAS